MRRQVCASLVCGEVLDDDTVSVAGAEMHTDCAPVDSDDDEDDE